MQDGPSAKEQAASPAQEREAGGAAERKKGKGGRPARLPGEPIPTSPGIIPGPQPLLSEPWGQADRQRIHRQFSG